MNRARERRFYHKPRIAGVRRRRDAVRESVYGRLCRHYSRRGKLKFAAERHENRRRADASVESFAHALLRAYVKAVKLRGQSARIIAFFDIIFYKLVNGGKTFFAVIVYHGGCGLLYAVGVQKFSLDVYNRFVAVEHTKARVVGHYRYFHRLKVFLFGKLNEPVRV